jgi:glutathione S-transferase
MKLYLNKTSPYARLALVTAHEAGLANRVDTVWVEPWNDPPELLAVNPAAKIPALVTDDGAALIESSCICEYLVALSEHPSLRPTGAERTVALQRLGLARATIDCAFGTVIQRRFNKGTDTELSARWTRALPRLATTIEPLTNRRNVRDPDLADLALGVAFDYVDFRLPEINWRSGAPALAKFVDALRQRPSLVATQPQ